MKDICLLALPIRSWDKLWLKLGTIGDTWKCSCTFQIIFICWLDVTLRSHIGLVVYKLNISKIKIKRIIT
jgi:hypothetical protein